MSDMNEILRSLNNRKSTRVFTGDHIPKEDTAAILNASFQAPTAGNQQLYTILNITDSKLKHTVSELCDHQPFIEEADLVLIYLADCKKYLDIYRAANVENVRKPGVGDLLLAMMDACIAAQNAAVAAESLGIGSCYIGDVIENAESMKEVLHLPDYVMPACMLVFGYPTKQQKNRTKPNRFRKEAIVFENTYADRSSEEWKEDFIIRANRDNYDFEKDIQAFCTRKYMSDFSIEMTRSVEVYLRKFMERDTNGK